MALRNIGIQLNSLRSVRARLGISHVSRQYIRSQQRICIRQTRISRGKRRIFRNGFSEIPDTFVQTVRRPLVPEISPFQISFVRIRIHRRRICRLRSELRRAYRSAHLLGYLSRGFRLHRQNVAHIAVVTSGPQVPVRGAVDQLCANPHAVSHSFHGAFHQCIHAKLFADLRRGFAAVAVMRSRSSRDYSQVRKLRQVGGQFVRHSVRKISLAGIGRKIL